ncbi:MAG: hypothetical protein FJ399_09625, partial [Verrucomicrobia bacterium]|nr:hypothetical protein [Verrucomicrobiota bacterium]
MSSATLLPRRAALLLAGAGLWLAATTLPGAIPALVDGIVTTDKVGLSPSYGSVIGLRDGTLLWVWGTAGKAEPVIHGTRSTDGGRTWSDPQPL